jgi:hypothetical protein
MKASFKDHKFWLISGIALLSLIIALYPLGVYNSLSMKLTRPEAINIATKFLTEQNTNINGFSTEAFLDNSPVEMRYLIKKLGGKGFKEYLKTHPTSLSWTVMFHLNLSKQIQQTTYYIDIAQDGSIFGYRREIPDSIEIKSLAKADATNLINSFLMKKYGDEFNSFKLVESKEEQYRNRTDFSFRWEKDESDLNAKSVLTAKVQGDQVGSYNYYFEVPQADREYFRATDAIFGTISVVFVVFLIMIAYYLFLKKYHQGEIWINVGRSIFIVFFLLSLVEVINMWPGLGKGATIGNISFLFTKIIVLLINGLILQFFIALLVFASWTVGESYARSLWPEKLKGVDSLIKRHIFSIHSGTGLMKGMVIGLAIALSFLFGGIILNQPEGNFYIVPSILSEIFIGWLPAIGVIVGSFTKAALASIAITFFIVNISYQRWKKKWVSILLSGLVTVLGIAIAYTPPSLNNFAVDLISYFIFGCFLAYLYFRFDLLTIASALFYTALTTHSFALYATNNSFYTLNFILVGIVFFIPPIIYLVSRFKNQEFVLENYGMPSHIQRISERERLKKELEIAAKVQLSLLPKEEPKIPGYEISAISIPAIEAGGDYFDFVKLSGSKLGIAIGDVSGKGVGAAIYMTLTKGILQAHAEEDVSPKNVLGKVNRLLYKTIEKNSFVSMFYAILDTGNHHIVYSRAGHNPGILCSERGGKTKLLFAKGMALGLEEGSVFSSTLLEEEIVLSNGDIFVLYTDGFTEAMNERHELYGEERLIKLIENNRNISSKDLLNLILKEVKKFVDNYPQHDDMTLVILKRL